MLRERVSSDIYIFTSELYVQVTAGAIMTPEGAIVIDTLPLPYESREMARFLLQDASSGVRGRARRGVRGGVRYVILTHYHADHTYGSYLYPDATVIGHSLCRQLLIERGRPALKEAKKEAQELEEITLRLPDITLEAGEMDLHVGGKNLRLLWTPGHSEDLISVFLEDEKALFASDTIMPIPIILDGDPQMLKNSLRRLMELEAESIIQGHGEVILRGEVQSTMQQGIDYLNTIEERVREAMEHDRPRQVLLEDDVEECGLSRVALDGRAQQLHTANLLQLYKQMQEG
jgi:glyoxylase-like metal-dependent hydrolase (beta-lactamase superfamily II)